MNSTPRLAAVSLCGLLLACSVSLLSAQERKGRELIGDVLKAVLERRESGQGAAAVTTSGRVDPSDFRAALAKFRQELEPLSTSAQRSGVQGIRALAPQIAKVQSQAKLADAYLARESQGEPFVQHCTALEQEWRPISNQVLQLRGADYQAQATVANLDVHMNDMWRSVGRMPEGSGFPATSGTDAQILIGLLDREIEALYDQVSLRQILSLSSQQTQRLFEQAVRLSDATAALDREISRSARPDVLAGAHRVVQQEWNSLETTLRGERTLRLDASCDRVDSYVSELADHFSGSGGLRGQQRSWPSGIPSGGSPSQAQLMSLATRLEVQAGDLAETLRRDSEYVRNESLRSTLVTQSTGFLGSAQSFRRFLMRPSVDRSGQVDATLLRRSWQETAASWNQLSTSLDQLTKQVRRADRYFPDVFRTQDEIAALIVQIQGTVK